MLNVQQAARLLGMPEETVVRWVRQGKLPVVEKSGRILFSRQELTRWARRHNIFLHDEASPDDGQDMACTDPLRLSQALRHGGVHFDIAGDSTEQVLANAVGRLDLPEPLDPQLVADLLIQRERLASTGIGGGVAIPHPRYPLDELPYSGLIAACFFRHPVDFAAIDGRPVWVALILLSNTTRHHLHYLSRLSYCLRQAAFIDALQHVRDVDQLAVELDRREDELDRMGRPTSTR